jgi:hypothetical protein
MVVEEEIDTECRTEASIHRIHDRIVNNWIVDSSLDKEAFWGRM